MNYFGIDVGGTSIKYGGVQIGEQIETENFDMLMVSRGMGTEKYSDAILSLMQSAQTYEGVGIGFPSVVWDDGIMNLDIQYNDIWVKAQALAKDLGIACSAINDADAAGFAELSHPGAGNLRKGVTIVLTLGTGIGSALFLNGQLLPNTEFGMLELHGMDVELFTAPSIKQRDQLTTQVWAERLQDYLSHLETIFSPDHIVLGGGISADYEEYRPFLTTKRAKLGPAYYRNQAGVIGAAVYTAACHGRR